MSFWAKLRSEFPQFDEQVRPGAFAQQDADDCWNSVITSMTQSLVRSLDCCPHLAPSAFRVDDWSQGS